MLFQLSQSKGGFVAIVILQNSNSRMNLSPMVSGIGNLPECSEFLFEFVFEKNEKII